MLHAESAANQAVRVFFTPKYSIGDDLRWVSRNSRATVVEIIATVHPGGTDIDYGCDTPLGMEVIPETDLA